MATRLCQSLKCPSIVCSYFKLSLTGSIENGAIRKMIAEEDDEVLSGYKQRVVKALSENPEMKHQLITLLTKKRAYEELLRALQCSTFTEDQAKEILTYMYKGTNLFYKHNVLENNNINR